MTDAALTDALTGAPIRHKAPKVYPQTRAGVAEWHSDQAAAYRLRAENWLQTAALHPEGLRRDRFQGCAREALDWAAFHQAFADVVLTGEEPTASAPGG